jgi:nitrate/nitrite transporter NarK
MENILTFYFQSIQKISALQSSIRFLPAPVSGAFMNIAMGLFVHRVRADILVTGAAVLACGAPLIMAAVSRVDSNYWTTSFWGVLLNPIGADTLFTVSNLLITSLFPQKTQGLAGGVFNTMAQIGKSVGLATSAIVAASITQQSKYADKGSPEALLEGYHAAWWYNFAQTVMLVFVSVWGLRKIGKVGIKRD